MYILKTTLGDFIQVDADELILIANAAPEALIFLRNGAVQRRMIATVTKDENRVETVLRLPGESESTRLERAQSEKSPDIFEALRRQINSDTKLLP